MTQVESKKRDSMKSNKKREYKGDNSSRVQEKRLNEVQKKVQEEYYGTKKKKKNQKKKSIPGSLRVR